MIKSFKLVNLECANCAAKMENDIAKIKGVDDAKVAFMSSRLKISFADGADTEEVLEQAQTIVSGYEKDCRIVQ